MRRPTLYGRLPSRPGSPQDRKPASLVAHIVQTGKKGTARLPFIIDVVCFLAVLAIGCLLSLGAVWP